MGILFHSFKQYVLQHCSVKHSSLKHFTSIVSLRGHIFVFSFHTISLKQSSFLHQIKQEPLQDPSLPPKHLFAWKFEQDQGSRAYLIQFFYFYLSIFIF